MPALKPNIGLALFAARPAFRIVWASVLLAAVAFALNPHWVADWMASTHRASARFDIPLLTAGGPLLLAALVAVGSPEGRLLLVMGCVPQTMYFYDQLPLIWVVRTRGEALFLAVASYASMAVWWFAFDRAPGATPRNQFTAPYVMAGCYLPAVAVVVRRALLRGEHRELVSQLRTGLTTARRRVAALVR
jgi:hypothetical protein